MMTNSRLARRTNGDIINTAVFPDPVGIVMTAWVVVDREVRGDLVNCSDLRVGEPDFIRRRVSGRDR
jgi:hypothetical protein